LHLLASEFFMQLLTFPTRLAFAPEEMDAARRALLRLVSDFGADIRPEQREWIVQIGNETARITLDAPIGTSANIWLEQSTTVPTARLNVVLRAVNPAGAKLLEVLFNTLKLEWHNPAKGPTLMRHQINRTQMSNIAKILEVLK
jgi:hypothetical protein